MCSGILIGAILGGLIAMADPRVRRYTKEKASCLSEKTVDLIKNPTKTTKKIRTSFDQISEQITKGTKWAVDTLETIEGSLDSLSKK